MSHSAEINSQSSNLTTIHTDQPPIVCRPTHLSVHNAYYWKVCQPQPILGSSRVGASRSSRVNQQEEKRRRRRQRRCGRDHQNSSELPIDDELTTKMQAWAVHEPKQTTCKETVEPEHVDPTGSMEKDHVVDC